MSAIPSSRRGAPLKIVMLGLSLTSSWGNGHATTYRALVRELDARGHDVLFLERNVPWYAANRDMERPPFGRLELYDSMRELQQNFSAEIGSADAVVVGSFVPEGAAVGKFVVDTAQGATCFYDIDTPITLSKLRGGDAAYITPELIPMFDLYASFTGGPTLQVLERNYGARKAIPLYCSVDPLLYYPQSHAAVCWDMGYLGTYSDDRQPVLEELLIEAARRWSPGRFVVAGPQYPKDVAWPWNVQRIEHIPPREHRAFYTSQRFTLNVTRQNMVEAGFSPSVRLFEAAACGTPIISDYWEGLETFFAPGSEILVSRSMTDTLGFLRDLSEEETLLIGRKARERVLAEHTASHRAATLEGEIVDVLRRKRFCSASVTYSVESLSS